MIAATRVARRWEPRRGGGRDPAGRRLSLPSSDDRSESGVGRADVNWPSDQNGMSSSVIGSIGGSSALPAGA